MEAEELPLPLHHLPCDGKGKGKRPSPSCSCHLQQTEELALRHETGRANPAPQQLQYTGEQALYLAQTAHQSRHAHHGGRRAKELNLSPTKIKRVGPVPHLGSTVELALMV